MGGTWDAVSTVAKKIGGPVVSDGLRLDVTVVCVAAFVTCITADD